MKKTRPKKHVPSCGGTEKPVVHDQPVESYRDIKNRPPVVNKTWQELIDDFSEVGERDDNSASDE